MQDNFLGDLNKPDVESITGLSPSISIDQKSTNNNPRSTVGTITEIYDYIRLFVCKNWNTSLSKLSTKVIDTQKLLTKL